MRILTLFLACAALVGCASAGGESGSATLSESTDTDQTLSGGGAGGDADAGPTGLGDTAPPSTLGNDCAADTDCGDGELCHRGVCVASCTSPADCGGGDCSADAV
ncbi:MAG: hypothetical protein RIT45_3327, partial [Pseudomonadota bacterium]